VVNCATATVVVLIETAVTVVESVEVDSVVNVVEKMMASVTVLVAEEMCCVEVIKSVVSDTTWWI
jgi:hypothetical protein